jgi:DCN1-like protein 1/2
MGRNTIEVATVNIQWQYDDYGWCNFDQKTSDSIEAAYLKNPRGTCTVTASNGQTYNITFADMKQENTSSNYKRGIQRKENKSNVRQVDVSDLKKLYDKYSKVDETDEPGIGGDGIMQFATEIGVDPMQVDLLVLFWKLKLTQQYFITENQWLHGMADLGLDTVSKAKSKVPKLKDQLSNPDSFSDFYSFCFKYMKDPDQKNLAIETAVATWKLILKGRYKYVDEWCTFIETVYKHSITPDLWKQFLEFTRDPSFKSFETFDLSMAAYPSAIDEWVDYAKEKGLDKKK